MPYYCTICRKLQNAGCYALSLAVNVTVITVARSPTLLHNYASNTTSYAPYISPTSSQICNTRNCQTVSPYASLMPRPCINKHDRGHGPKSHRLSERRHLKFHICLLLYSPHIPSWRTSNSSKRLLLLVVTTIPMNRPTRQIGGNTVVTAVRSVILRGKPRMGWILGNSFLVLSRGDMYKSCESLVT